MAAKAKACYNKKMVRKAVRPRPISGVKPRQNRGFFHRLVSSQRFLAIIGLAFLLVVAIPLVKTYNQRQQVAKEIAEIQKEIDNYENQNEDLKELISYLQSDQSLESQARLNLNLKKPGEQVIVIEDKRPTATAALGDKDGPGSNLARWWQYFFN